MNRNELSSHEKKWKDLRCMLLRERSQSEQVTFCVISTMRHFGKDKTIVTAKTSVIDREKGRDEQVQNRIFRAMKLLYIILQWWIHDIIYFSKSIQLYNTKNNPNVNCRLQLIIMQQYWLTNFRKCTMLCKMLMIGETVYTVSEQGRGGIQELCTFCLSFL